MSGNTPLVVRNTAWAAGNEGLRLVSTLAVFYLVTTELGPAGYGRFAGISAFTATLTMLSSTWIVQLLLQEAIRHQRPLDELLPRCLALAAGAGLLATALAVPLGLVLFPGVSFLALLCFTSAELLGGAAVSIGAGTVQSQGRFGHATRITLRHVVCRMAAVVALALLTRITLTSLAVTLFTVSTVLGWISLRTASRTYRVPIGFARPSLVEVRQGMSYAFTMASFGVQEDSDKTLMVRLGSPAEAGVYAAGYRAVQIAMLPIRSLVSATHNSFLDHDETLSRQHVRRSARYASIAGAYALVATAVLYLASNLLMKVLGSDYREASVVVKWIAPLVLLRAISLFPFNGLMGAGRTGIRTAIVATSAAVNLVGNIILIPLHSWRGAAAATFISEVVFVVLTWSALLWCDRPRKHLPAPVPHPELLDPAQEVTPA
jgi:O-antigen/teichoic acid export membrane protein